MDAIDRLEDERNVLMHSFGEGAWHDGLVRDRIEEIDRELIQRAHAPTAEKP